MIAAAFEQALDLIRESVVITAAILIAAILVACVSFAAGASYGTSRERRGPLYQMGYRHGHQDGRYDAVQHVMEIEQGTERPIESRELSRIVRGEVAVMRLENELSEGPMLEPEGPGRHRAR